MRYPFVHCSSKSNHASLHSRLHRPVDSQQHIASHRCSPIGFIWTSRWKQYGFAGAIWCTTCTSKHLKTQKTCQTKQNHLLMNIECTRHSKTSGTKTHCWWAVQVEMVEASKSSLLTLRQFQGHSLDRTRTASFSPGAQLFMHPDTSNVPCWWSGALSHVSSRWGSWEAHIDVVLLSSTSKKSKRRLTGVIQFSLLNLYIYIFVYYIIYRLDMMRPVHSIHLGSAPLSQIQGLCSQGLTQVGGGSNKAIPPFLGWQGNKFLGKQVALWNGPVEVGDSQVRIFLVVVFNF